MGDLRNGCGCGVTTDADVAAAAATTESLAEEAADV